MRHNTNWEYALKSLWVQMLEKAFVTGSFRVDMKTLVTYMGRVFYTNAPTVKQ